MWQCESCKFAKSEPAQNMPPELNLVAWFCTLNGSDMLVNPGDSAYCLEWKEREEND